MGSFVVLMNDDSSAAESQLKALHEKLGLKKLVLAVGSEQGPPKYKIAKDAEVTVMLYTKKKVVKNFAYGKGKLDDKGVEEIVASVKDILPAKK
ncbi:MAG: hypothetical protein LC104_13245 [Bacteroidales bacterium]|nr:hypothetical protein [Bacteroidales bacterium]